MKFVNFPEANHHVKGFHYYQTREGLIVMALELDKDDLAAMKKGDKLFVIAGPGLALPPPLQITRANPFKPLPNETTDKKSTSDNEQPHKGDN